MKKGISRRQFWRVQPAEALRTIITGAGPGEEAGSRPIRPPGADPDENVFLSRCERCAECSIACTYGVIDHLGPAWGVAEGTPVLDPETKPCRWCATWDCVSACPSGALSLEDGAVPGPIGKVSMDIEACLVKQGTLCDECSYSCPPSVRAITLQGKFPRLDEDACVGCGLCAFQCPAEPAAITYQSVPTLLPK